MRLQRVVLFQSQETLNLGHNFETTNHRTSAIITCRRHHHHVPVHILHRIKLSFDGKSCFTAERKMMLLLTVVWRRLKPASLEDIVETDGGRRK
ncbi:hypothetical protein L1887_14935 [Cichorium endivia]|nr:hypothetical protein L1887_14935 [Cichorium endivia]